MALTNPTSPARPPTRGRTDSVSLQLTVTGTDDGGRLFRESAPLVRLEGRKCTFRSKFRVLPESWLIVEIRENKHEGETWRAGAQVQTVSPAKLGQNRFDVGIELERAHDSVVIPDEGEATAGSIGPAPTLPEPLPAIPPTSEIAPMDPPSGATVPEPDQAWVTLEPAEHLQVTPNPESTQTHAENPTAPNLTVPCAEEDLNLVELAANVEEVSVPKVVEMIHEGLAAEYERQLSELKATISSEVEKAAQDILSARMATVLETAFQTRMEQYVETIPAITDKVMEQLTGRLTQIPQLEACVEALSQGLTERWSEVSRNAAETAQQTVTAKIAEIEKLAKQIIGGLECKMVSHRMELHSIVELSQTAMQESATASQRAQETMKRLSEVIETAAPLMDVNLRAQFESRSSEFNNKIDHIVIERAAKFMSEIELLLASQIEDAQQAIRELAAQLQTSEKLLQKQQDNVHELLHSTGNRVEQEIKSVLRRLSGPE